MTFGAGSPAALLPLISLGYDSIAAETLTARVVSIADGYTLTLLVDCEQITIRLSDIDASETAQPYGTKAKQAVSDLAFGKTVPSYHVQGPLRPDTRFGVRSTLDVDAQIVAGSSESWPAQMAEPEHG